MIKVGVKAVLYVGYIIWYVHTLDVYSNGGVEQEGWAVRVLYVFRSF